MLVEPFWTHLDTILNSSELVIDRPKGSFHPRYPSLVYPVDYGYLAATTSGDGDGIDVWLGSSECGLDAVVCTVDVLKNDVEVKLLLGCSEEEKEIVCGFHNENEYMAAILVRR